MIMIEALPAAADLGFDIGSLTIAVGAFLGAALSVAVAELIKSRFLGRQKRESLRLDNLRNATVEVTSQARRMLHLVGSKGAPVDLVKLEDAHQAVRIGVDQLQLVGDVGVQEAAMLIRHHSYSLREQGEGRADKHEDYTLNRYNRLEQAVENLLSETRRALAVGGAVAPKPNYAQMTARINAARASGQPRV
ncbi:hypothetical protein [Cryobacterium sp. AP23]